MKYFHLCLWLALSSAAWANPPFVLEEASIADIKHAIQSKQITCVALTQAYLTRIKLFDLSATDKPSINALSELNTSALTEAAALDRAFDRTHRLTGPLHCVPVIIKDNIDAYDLTTTSGSLALLGTQPRLDAPLVEQLRQAGAIILAKGGMDEFAWGVSGISSRSGRIGNAYDPSQNPGGSSGGPAAGVSANFALIGIGTDNSGSVRIPAVFNGLIGLRPTMGLIDQAGIFPMGKLDGTAGPMTRTVEDLAKTLDVIAKPDSTRASYVTFLRADGLKGKRIGVVRRVAGFDAYKNMPEAVSQLLNQALKTMQAKGAVIIDPIDVSDFDVNRRNNEAGEIEDVDQYLAAFPATRQSFTDICLSDRTRNFGSQKDCLAHIKNTPDKNSRAYQAALTLFAKNRQAIEGLMEAQHLNALMLPISTTGSATYDSKRINTWQAPIASNAGLPALSFSVGLLKGMPVGIEIIGKAFNEGTLLSISYAYEQAEGKRTPPTLPIANAQLMAMDIAELNHLFTQLGYDAYSQVLKNTPSDKDKNTVLTPSVFQMIVKSNLQGNV